jgi:hypothetical protein
MGRGLTVALIAGLVVAVGIGLAVGVLAGNRTSPTPSLLPAPDPTHIVHCTSVQGVADACRQNGLDVRPPIVGQACALPAGGGLWTVRGTSLDRICAPRQTRTLVR